MPRGASLTEKEQGAILEMSRNGMKSGEIGDRLQRHRNTIINFLKNPNNYGLTKRSGRKSSITTRCKREIRRLAVEKGMSCNQIKAHLKLPISRHRVIQILHENKSIVYDSRVPEPRLLKRHMCARLTFANKYKFWDDEWHNVVFSDEKKFNLDGPDSCQKYWRDKKQQRQTYKKRVHGGGSLMIWAAFSYKGKSPLCFITTNMNAQSYVNLLDDVLIDFADELHEDKWTFQQDNAPIHAAKLTKEFFKARNIPVLEWPAVSPDLNPIEDLWGMLSAAVYKNGQQFDTLKELKRALQEEWQKIPENKLKALVNSMPRRLTQVEINRGKHINY